MHPPLNCTITFLGISHAFVLSMILINIIYISNHKSVISYHVKITPLIIIGTKSCSFSTASLLQNQFNIYSSKFSLCLSFLYSWGDVFRLLAYKCCFLWFKLLQKFQHVCIWLQHWVKRNLRMFFLRRLVYFLMTLIFKLIIAAFFLCFY